jgi:hypothetical protein
MDPRRVPHESGAAHPFLVRIVPALAILLAIAGPGFSAERGPTTSTGVQVTKSVPFARESIDEIRARGPLRAPAALGDRAIPLRRIQRRSGVPGKEAVPSAMPVLAAPSVSSFPAPLAPALESSFAGLGNPPHSEGDVIPPDTMGAAGPNHLVSLLNSNFGVFSKSGTLLQKATLQAFWASLGIAAGEPANFPFDTKILYDQHSGRFIAITLGGTSAPVSWVMIAVSSTSDPSGSWNKWAIDADEDNGVPTGNSADFPGLGVDAFNVYVAANMFNGADVGQYSKVWVIPKARLLAGGNPLTWFEFSDPQGSDFTIQPAHTFGTPGAEYFLFEGSTDRLALAWMDNTSGTPVWHPPLQVPVTHYTSTNSLPDAPQPDNANGISTSDTRLLNTVYRNGSVWTTHHLAVNGKVEVAWYRINPVTATVESQGRVTDPYRWYYYPSIAVNQDNVAAIGFSGSSTTEYAGGYYTIIRPSSGTAEPVALLKAGLAPYWKTLNGTENRWGDFSATVVDPIDNVTFWTLQEYADSPISGISQWGTWWGKFTPGATEPPQPPSGSSGSGGGGCLSVSRSGAEASLGTSLFCAGILLLPACALGLRRIFLRRNRTSTIRHPLC